MTIKEFKYIGDYNYSILNKLNAFIASEMSNKEKYIIEKLLNFTNYFDIFIDKISRGSDYDNSESVSDNQNIKYLRQGPQIKRYKIESIKYIDKILIGNSVKMMGLLKPKLIAKPLRGKRLAFIYDNEGAFITGSNFSNIFLKSDFSTDQHYKFILALLNSELVSLFMVAGLYSNNTETARHIDKDYLFRVPVPILDFKNLKKIHFLFQ
jgi:hypothetical protein